MRSPRFLIALVLVAAVASLNAAPKPAKRAAAPGPSLAGSRWFGDYAGHAVKWQRWSGMASRSDRLQLLTIGEVGCLPCRKLMRSLDARDVAAIVNSRFTPLLLDRSEYPEVADAYAAAFERSGRHEAAMVVLTPDLVPLAAIDVSSVERIGSALIAAADAWSGDRESLLAPSRALMARAYQRASAQRATEAAGATVLLERLTAGFDTEHRRFAPLAPEFSRLLPIVRIAQRGKNARARQIGEDALRRISSSGLHDAIGGGVHRAAVDGSWTVPQFEKDLIDQVFFAEAALELWKVTGRDEHRHQLRSALDFMIDGMQVADGAFTHSLDSESLHPRGRPLLLHGIHYAWQLPELELVLGKPMAGRVAKAFAMTAEGNVTPALDREGSLQGWNLAMPAAPLPGDPEFAEAVAKLRRLRRTRPGPAAELSAVTGLNGAAISLLARAAQSLGEERYLNAAATAARVMLRARDPRTKGFRHATGSAAAATVDDLALLAIAFTDLYQATADVRWLDHALGATAELARLEEGAGYRIGASVPEPVRPLLREGAGSTVSQHGTAALALLRLGALTGNGAWQARARSIVAARSATVNAPGDPFLVLAADFVEAGRQKQAVIVGPRGLPATEAYFAALKSSHAPYAEVLQFSGVRSRAELAKRVPWVASLEVPETGATAYVCQDGLCSSPIAEPGELAARIQ